LQKWIGIIICSSYPCQKLASRKRGTWSSSTSSPFCEDQAVRELEISSKIHLSYGDEYPKRSTACRLRYISICIPMPQTKLQRALLTRRHHKWKQLGIQNISLHENSSHCIDHHSDCSDMDGLMSSSWYMSILLFVTFII
jgi:hypothetical protein